MSEEQARAEYDRLGAMHEAHGMIVKMLERLRTCVELLRDNRDAEAEELARDCWHGCLDMRAAFMRCEYTEDVGVMLESIEVAECSALDWLDIVRTKPANFTHDRVA